ncbi:MAG: DnaJ domain-containing protein [Acidobacteriota bacterium]|nr:DnaJ domain-containing protein [Acidobacteriota bacterium]
MTATNQLEFKGKIASHSVDELLIELAQNRLTGSLRLSSGEKKSIVYFDDGAVVFAVSNARDHRLYSILLEQGQINENQLTEIDEFTNDMLLASVLVEKGTITRQAIDSVFAYQFSVIIKETLGWTDGEFVFSASTRVKADLHFAFDLTALLREHIAALDIRLLTSRFKSLDEKFALMPDVDLTSTDLTPEDAFILSRLSGAPISIDALRAMTGFESEVLLPTLYKLWLGGFVSRLDWASAISPEDKKRLARSSFELKKSARSYEEDRAEAARKAQEESAKEAELIREEEEKEEEEELTLEKYLKTVEEAATHYEIFVVSPDADIAEIKKAYFFLAKRFHPDLFYRTVDEETQVRVQNAFTEIAQAYETLKDHESREVYDFKLRKVIEQLREAESGKESGLTEEDMEMTGHSSKAAESFEAGYEHLLAERIEAALPLLGRAAYMESKNARFRAFYGRALSYDRESYRKAENEFREAIRLEPKNAHYRLMLAELLVEIGHKVRARGELNRLLKFDPENKEANRLLDTLEDS